MTNFAPMKDNHKCPLKHLTNTLSSINLYYKYDKSTKIWDHIKNVNLKL